MLSALCDVWELTRFTGTLICMNNCPLKSWYVYSRRLMKFPPLDMSVYRELSINYNYKVLAASLFHPNPNRKCSNLYEN